MPVNVREETRPWGRFLTLAVDTNRLATDGNEIRGYDVTENENEPREEVDRPNETARTDDAPPTDDRVDALERTVEALAERVSDLERTVTWMARQQARETGNGACPRCHTGGALRVERTPAGKKRVTCSNCDETFD